MANKSFGRYCAKCGQEFEGDELACKACNAKREVRNVPPPMVTVYASPDVLGSKPRQRKKFAHISKRTRHDADVAPVAIDEAPSTSNKNYKLNEEISKGSRMQNKKYSSANSIRIAPEELEALAEEASSISEEIIQGYSKMLKHIDRLDRSLSGPDYDDEVMRYREALKKQKGNFNSIAMELHTMETRIAAAHMEPIYGTPDMMTGNTIFLG